MRKTVSLENGKYEFDLEDCRMVAARRYGEDWPAGLELRFTKCLIAALERILELENCGPEIR